METYRTNGGIDVRREIGRVDVQTGVESLIDALDERRGVLLASSYEYPGRYTRWDIGFVDPPICFTGRGRTFRIEALNDRGVVLLPAIEAALAATSGISTVELVDRAVDGVVADPAERVPEELRSRQPTLFTVLRSLGELFGSPDDAHLGLYGAFGYDLVFQFEMLRLRLPRPDDQRDVVLYLPDEIIVIDHRREVGQLRSYDFTTQQGMTEGIARDGASQPFVGATSVDRPCDHEPGEFAKLVEVARDAFKRGDLFEATPGRTFFEPCPAPPSEIFRRLRERNPSPYGFVISLGPPSEGRGRAGGVRGGGVAPPPPPPPPPPSNEHLVGASPEMYVRVEGDRVETCPIAGTIARGRDPIDDAEKIRTILNSTKDESELTMCTDVDRNDKARVCVPGSVKVIGRRQIEMYSRLIHTVDHVEGRLREGFDSLDAFLTHAWAVTVTGAPKIWAMQFIEDHERSARAWYGGAVGRIGFDGDLNTGLTLRTIRIKNGVAEIRAGATLLYDSDPDEEEEETAVKASAFLDAIRRPRGVPLAPEEEAEQVGAGKRVLLVDHQDSFVHTLADYFRQTGAEVTTLRAGFDHAELDRLAPDLVVLSPGPGRPEDFDVSGTIAAAVERSLPIFGVCLGLQGIVEHFGGRLGVLDTPMHGKPSRISPKGGVVFDAFPDGFVAGRYHSLFALDDEVPGELIVTASSDDGVVMGVEHAKLPVWAVQFHPESILTLEGRLGHKLVRNVMSALAKVRP
ncbi:MAG: anthranilate synthase [Actinomycetota bacterium]